MQSVKLSGQWKQKWIHFGLLFVFHGGLWTHLLDGCGYIRCSPLGKCVWEFIHLFETGKKNLCHFVCSHYLLFCHPFLLMLALHCLSPMLLPSCNCLKVLLVLHDCGIKKDETCWSLNKSATSHFQWSNGKGVCTKYFLGGMKGKEQDYYSVL